MRSPIKEQDNAGQWRPWAEHGGRRFRVGRSGKSLFLLPCYNTTAHCQTDESEGVHHVNRLFFMGKPKLVFFLRFWSRKKTCADWPKWRAHVVDLLRIWVNVVNSGNVWLWLNFSLLGLWKPFRSNFESNFCEIECSLTKWAKMFFEKVFGRVFQLLQGSSAAQLRHFQIETRFFSQKRKMAATKTIWRVVTLSFVQLVSWSNCEVSTKMFSCSFRWFDGENETNLWTTLDDLETNNLFRN